MKTKACHCCDGTGVELDNAAVGKMMRERRIDSGRSLRSVAQRLGKSAAYISDLERGFRKWSAEKTRLYVEALKK